MRSGMRSARCRRSIWRRSRKSSSAAGSRTVRPGHNIARVAAMRAGLPVTTAAVTVNRFCNSGLQAVVQAAHLVMNEQRRRGDRRRRRVDHDDGPRQLAEPVGPGARPRHLHGDGRHRRGRRQALQRHAAGAGRVLARQPAAHRPGAAGRLLPRRDRADEGHPRHPRQEERREDRRGGSLCRARRVQPSRHHA